MWKGILLWLFVINLGVAFGAGLYEARVFIPQWENSPPRAWPNTGLMFWVYVTTVPLTVPTIANQPPNRGPLLSKIVCLNMKNRRNCLGSSGSANQKLIADLAERSRERI